MSRSLARIVVAAGLVLAFVPIVSSQQPATPPPVTQPAAQPAPPPPAAAQPSQDAIMMTMPDEHHRLLATLTGKWIQKVVSRAAPDAPWKESAGHSVYRSILGGRFILEEVKCDIQGTPYEWMGMYGFDKLKKKFIATWADNTDTQFDYAESDPDPRGHVLNFLGDAVNPVTGEKRPFHWRITFERSDRIMLEMFEPGPDGKEYLTIQIVQTRSE